MHSAPRDEHWLLDKFKFKLDLFTIGKILLKLIIFKKIIKFIALICLLLFLPKLQTKHMNFMDLLGGGDDSDEETESSETIEKRSFDYCKPYSSDCIICVCVFRLSRAHRSNALTSIYSIKLARSRRRQINEVSRFAKTAIETFAAKHLPDCGDLRDIQCRFHAMVDRVDEKYPYER